ncbi:MAG: glutamate 5-kinase [Sulfurimonas sp.]|nr:glutamate 5-kinase [Sulfurimonas sp.]
MKRIVVKVGSAVLAHNDSIAIDRMENLVDFLAELKKNNEVILVSSGAVAAGYTKIQLDRSIIRNKQALASIGQPILMHTYTEKFLKHNIIISQVLLTSANFSKTQEIIKIKNTVDTLISNNIIPIVNENDATATDELEVGDNDQLSAYITKHIDADILIILSDIDAYYDKDPRKSLDAKILKVINKIDQKDLNRDATPHGTFATGGIVTKLKAASYLLDKNIDTFLATGFDLSDVKSYLLDNHHIGGTLFTNRGSK